MDPAQARARETSWSRDGAIEIRTCDHLRHGLVSVRIPDARTLDHDAFSSLAEHAYGAVLDRVPKLQASYPIRMWNVIPGILEPLGGLEHRYMVFNQSRYRAFCQRSGNRFETYLPTATGVGNLEGSDDLVIHCLTATAAGHPIENPRQVPAYRYSERFGPKPPCFSRATSIDLEVGDDEHPRRFLLIGGTASVRGEDSHHSGHLDRQLDETELNLRALAAVTSGSRTDWAGCFHHLRVYHRRPEDRERLETAITHRFPVSGEIEFFNVNICRDELLVEIEGVFAPTG